VDYYILIPFADFNGNHDQPGTLFYDHKEVLLKNQGESAGE